MVFTRLSPEEKDTFFGLLDEYFQSRPEIFARAGDHGDASSAATSAVHRALAKNPQVTSKLVSAGVSHGLAKSNNPYASAIASKPEVSSSIGRVAAASLAFTGGGGSAPNSTTTTTTTSHSTPNSNPSRSLLPSLPQRSSSAFGATSSGSEIDKLVSKKASVFSAFNNSSKTNVAIPPAFPVPKGTFAPPPVRRTTSEAPPIVPRRQAEPEPEEPQGEWAEALYDYTSEDPGDLEIQQGARVLVTAKSSDDWWTGQILGEGREGLFPASYVRLL